MLHAMLIAIIAIVLARDGVAELPLLHDLNPWLVLSMTLVSMAMIIIAQHLYIRRLDRILGRTGQWSCISAAETTLTIARIATITVHAFAVIVFGWVDVVRELIGGNLILIDEAIAVIPAFSVIILGWASYFPIERHLREHSIIRSLDSGGPMPALITCWQYIFDQMRHSMLFIAIPIALIGIWAESMDAILPLLAARFPILDSESGPIIASAIHFAGIIAVLIIMPVILRRIWSTVPLGAGPLRDRLLRLCEAQGVRCRAILVWRTYTNMLNGAVIGMLPSLRYILLTETLLERLPQDQVEAVMAHEVAHARKHHLPWLLIVVLVVISYAWYGTIVLLSVLFQIASIGASPGPLVASITLAITFIIAFIVFGWVSRRFEEQADAFAVQHLSGLNRATKYDRGILITADAVASMSYALANVATYNHFPPNRFTWRHGSINSRRLKLAKLIGRPAAYLPVDRTVFLLRIVAVIGLSSLIAIALLQVFIPE